MVDYKNAIWSPNTNFFPDSGKKSFLILHGTAGGSSAREIASFFQGTEGSGNPVSSTYIVDQAGVIVQTVLEKDGAWGNGVVTNPNWLGNPNTYTISIEHVKPDYANATALTPAQQAASFALIKDICQRNGIGMHDADDTTGITGHFSIDPVNRARCPGNFPWDELWAYLANGGTTPVNNTPTAYQIKEALDCWKSYFERTLGQPAPVTGTGIYQAWVSDWVNRGRHYGPPITREYDSNNWSGGHIICQEFAHARCEYSNGVSTWYTPNG